jgi:hypothetical protein
VEPRLKLPRYVHGFLDRHGRPRFYFRRPGFESVPLPGLPYSPEFMRAYEGAVAGQPRLRQTARPGTMAALALSYFGSPQFGALRASSQYAYRAPNSLFRYTRNSRPLLLQRRAAI